MAMWNFSKNLGGEIFARAAQGADFKKRCMKSKRYDAAVRDEYF